MSPPRFSVVVPTRERADTLRSCLATCLGQDFDDYEVVVCDNCSSPATRAVVDELASPKIKYVRAPEPLAMSDNWELALSHAAGEYVMLLGDDDGLLPFALRELDRLLARTGARVLRWDAAFYLWPTINLPGEGNFLRVPLGRAVRTVNGPELVRAVASFRAEYHLLPMLYNAAVHRDVIAAVRAKAGRVFANRHPDVYSGFVFAHAAGEYLSSEVPLTVAGLSHQSNGVATLFLRGRHPVARDFHALNARAGLAGHPWVPDLPVFPAVPVADSYLCARQALFPEEGVPFDRRDLALRCVNGIVADTPEEWQAALARVRSSCADDPALLGWFDGTVAGRPHVPSKRVPLRSPHMGFQGGGLHLNADEFGVQDVAGAARLCDRILCYGGSGVSYLFPSAEETREADGLRQQLQEKEAALRELTEAADGLRRQLQEKEPVIRELAEAAETRLGLLQEKERQLRDRDYQLREALRRSRPATLGAALRALLRRAGSFLRGRRRPPPTPEAPPARRAG